MSYSGRILADQQEAQIKALCYMMTGILPEDQSISVRQNIGPLARRYGQNCELMVQDEILMDKVRSDAVEKAKLVPPLEMPAGIRERTQALLSQGGFQARRIRSKKYDATLDIALGKSLNKMRGIEMSGLRPEHFVVGFETDKGHLDRELTEDEFKEAYFQLLKSDKLSKQEHDVRCERRDDELW